jgi:hypothetical protein
MLLTKLTYNMRNNLPRAGVLLVFMIQASLCSGQLPDSIQYEYKTCKLPLTYLDTGDVIRRSAAITYDYLTWNRIPLLDITGDLSYQHFTRHGNSDNLLLINSRADIATLRLQLLYKETYPLSFQVRYNKSSPFQLDDQYEVSFGFDQRNFKEILKNKLLASAKSKFHQKQAALLARFENIYRQFQEKKQWLESPVYAQQVIEERLRQARNPVTSLPGNINLPTAISRQLPNLPNLPELIFDPQALGQTLADSLKQRFDNLAGRLQNGLHNQRDSLLGILQKLEDSLLSQKKKYESELDSLGKKLSGMNTVGELEEYADSTIPRNKWADLLMRTQLRFGKFIHTGSELTVNNIFLHGASIRYGNEKFIQLSGGFYDFAFRQVFQFRNDSMDRKKSLVAVKIGKTDGNNLSAFNFYIGQKQKTGSRELRTIAGVSAERKLYLNRNLSLELELAKSTTKQGTGKQDPVIKDLFTSLSMRTIGAYGSLKAWLPKTKTDAEISYRYWGQQFESFNANQYFNPQNNITAKVTQPLFNRRLNIAAGLKYTDFKSYGIASNIKTKTLFATANATLRIRKLPVVSVGYYPGSQLYWMDNSKLYEYFYYILNASVSHYFKIGRVPMQAVFTHNKFMNHYTDSAVKNTQRYNNLFWTCWVGSLSFQASYSQQELETENLRTAEAGLSYSVSKFRIGGTAKWNFLSAATRMGYTANLGISLGKLGSINLIYDRSYLPERTGGFVPVNTGQVQIIKPLKFRIWQKS